MSWDNIDKTSLSKEEIDKAAKNRNAEAAALAQLFHRLFTSEDGVKAYQYLFDKFVMNNVTPLSCQNPEYEAGYHNGEAGVIKYIASQIAKAQTL